MINVLVSSFDFIWLPMLWVYSHRKLVNSFTAVTVFRRQNKVGPRAESAKACRETTSL